MVKIEEINEKAPLLLYDRQSYKAEHQAGFSAALVAASFPQGQMSQL